ncbi:MAG TPA: PP0621 family protein [Albitalea sp.]
MKYLLIIAIVLLILWVARSARRPPPPPPSARPDAKPVQQPMLACAHCGLHLPSGEALPGRGGVFCGEAHRAAYEKSHPLE